WLCEGTIIDLLGAAESREQAAGVPTNAEEVVVVADVEIVDLASLANLAHVEPEHGLPGEEDACFEHSVCATYNVDMRVREVRRGKCPFRRFCFSAVHDAVNASATGDWLFFRGMTLEVGLARVDGKLKINRFEPVFPYPPYSKDGIRIIRSGTDDVSPFLADGCVAEDVREYTNWRGLKDGISGSLVALQYGDRELALFASTTNLIEGLYGIFPDYGPSVKITVYGDEGSNFDYWRNAWFAESAVTIRSLGEEDGFVRTKEAETVAAGTCPDLDVLTKELSSIGFADVAGATYAQVSPYPADSGAFWTDEYIRMSGLALDERLSGDGWIVLPKDGAANAKFLAYGCVWWEARLKPPETNDVRRVSYDKARLARDVVLVRTYVEDAAEIKSTLDEDCAADILAFALHARQSGFAKESERIASALFAIKASGDAALSGIRKRLAKIAAEYPDFATWEKKELARKEELEKRRKADESDSDAEEEL
ncbi:MAG: hypothetical protein J6Q49_08330, partial [Kiritimatiellae bacterium]|nr:hypothetical protein [Kiritimatiellia bacterium]